jgi:RNA polymerase sigma-70 factor (ECF subfamily)
VSSSSPDFSAIIERAQRGDRTAFAQLVDALYPRALRFAAQMLSHTEDAEEAVQDTFVRVHRYIGGFQLGAPFDPWFFRILANRCRTMIEKRQRHHAIVEYGDVPHDAAADYRTPLPDEFRHAVFRVLNTLPAEQREAFLLRHIEDLSYDDMIDITGASLSALRMRVKRACDALRLQLAEVYHDR